MCKAAATKQYTIHQSQAYTDMQSRALRFVDEWARSAVGMIVSLAKLLGKARPSRLCPNPLPTVMRSSVICLG
ncbi:hypothetical protein VTI28DRAFT_439 [Corynascus sepedonium]